MKATEFLIGTIILNIMKTSGDCFFIIAMQHFKSSSAGWISPQPFAETADVIGIQHDIMETPDRWQAGNKQVVECASGADALGHRGGFGRARQPWIPGIQPRSWSKPDPELPAG